MAAKTQTAERPRLRTRFDAEIKPRLQQELSLTNVMQVPRFTKIVVNMGVGKALTEKNRMEVAAEQLAQITGQKAQVTKAKKAVSGFRLRENNEIGCRVTLRGQRMYEFLDRLISIALPRIRDFRGITSPLSRAPTATTRRGSYYGCSVCRSARRKPRLPLAA
jgi:large subunit ribosomal protein L5